MCRRPCRIARRTAAAIFVFFVTVFARASVADGDAVVALTPADAAILASVVGNPDAGRLSRTAQALGSAKLLVAIYHGSRAQRYAAIEAAPYSDSPGELLPSLAALLAASERGTAARAAASLRAILEDPSSHARHFQERTVGEMSQIIDQLVPVTRDGRLDPDIRIAAIIGIERLTVLAAAKRRDWSLPLFDDSDVSIRRAAVEAQTLPLADDMLRLVAKTVDADASAEVRGVAAALLCENAVSHNVKEPSPDLTVMLQGVLRSGAIPSDVEAEILVCLTRFESSDRRREIVDAAVADARPEIAELIQSLHLR